MKITYKNWMFDSSRTEKAAPTREQSLSCESISADTLTVVVRCDDPSIMSFQKNDAIRFWENDSNASMQTYYLRSIERTGATAYKIVAWSAVGLLATIPHKGGIYTGQTVSEVISDICGAVPVVVKSVFANVKLYGWLPYCQPKTNGQGKSARDNLAQVLFAIGAYLTTDLNGVLHIDSLWDGTASVIQGNRMYLSGGKVGYSDPISAVTVTEHQYVAGTEAKELFSGTAQNGDIITFSEPMHSLSATGFTILESGANYAKISAGTGALTGKAYIHNTRLITQPVTAGAVENVKSVTDATLVSLVNSYAVAKRLADYYRCRETITNDIVSGHEKPGHVVSVYHPYDKKMVSACIQSLDTTMSATLKSSMEALVGFTPSQPESAEYFDERVVLTGDGQWTVPIGVESYEMVLIGPGEFGTDGANGTNGEGAYLSFRSTGSSKTQSVSGGVGGKGGGKGFAGSGGSVYRTTIINAIPGTTINYSCGISGNLNKAHTMMGDFSSESGASSDVGYIDSVTGDRFAQKGIDGMKGGDGGRGGTVSTMVGEDGEAVNGNPGGTGSPGASGRVPATKDGKVVAYVTYTSCGGGGSGAVNDNPGNSGEKAAGANGVNGGNAAPAKSFGSGGNGGNGGSGGGGGCGFQVKLEVKSGESYPFSVTRESTGGTGGQGSKGSSGGDGCIILYYRKPKPVQSGPLATSDGKWLLDALDRRMIV